MHDPIRHSPENGPLALQPRGSDGNAWLIPMQNAESLASKQNLSSSIRTLTNLGNRQRANTQSRERLDYPAGKADTASRRLATQ